MKEKLFVLSMDAMVHEDIAYLMTKLNFSRLMAKCACVEKVRTVYPAITYPAHTSIITGCNPGKHGIYNNQSFTPYKEAPDAHYPHWYLYHKSVRVEDLFAAAKRAGCTTAAVYWPITGCNPNIDHIINEYFFPAPFVELETVEKAFTRMGADEVALQAVRENLHRLPHGPKQSKELQLNQTYDDFIMGCTNSLIRSVQPDVLLVHNCWLDDLRHRNGVFNDRVTAGLDQTDLWLGEVIRTMEQAGVFENTNFVVLSDHGQMDFTRRINFNVLLARGGFLDVAPNGSVYDWQAFGQSNGMSVSVYLNDPNNKPLWQQVYDYLCKLAAEGTYGFNRVYTTREVREKYGQYGPFSFMVETDGSATFSEEFNEPLDSPVVINDYRLGNATHGYEPEKGPQPVFYGRGPAFREHVTLPTGRIIDVAPTLARILGQELPKAEGKCMQELLR